MIHVGFSVFLFATRLLPAAFHPIRRDDSEILTAVAGIADPGGVHHWMVATAES